jgi:hypothetical protein
MKLTKRILINNLSDYMVKHHGVEYTLFYMNNLMGEVLSIPKDKQFNYIRERFSSVYQIYGR